jgi:hypothetical protein
MVALPDEHKARQILTEVAREFLTELSELPEKVFQHEKGEGEKPVRPANAATIQAEEERVQRRRVKKATTMRELRARGKIA